MSVTHFAGKRIADTLESTLDSTLILSLVFECFSRTGKGLMQRREKMTNTETETNHGNRCNDSHSLSSTRVVRDRETEREREGEMSGKEENTRVGGAKRVE